MAKIVEPDNTNTGEQDLTLPQVLAKVEDWQKQREKQFTPGSLDDHQYLLNTVRLLNEDVGFLYHSVIYGLQAIQAELAGLERRIIGLEKGHPTERKDK